MSYILDALRKADHERERERGGVPDLHAQPAPPVATEPRTASRAAPALVWAVATLTLLLLALLAWLWAGRAAPPPAAAPVVASATTAERPLPSSAVPAPPPVAPAAPLLPPPAELQPAPLAEPAVVRSAVPPAAPPVVVPARPSPPPSPAQMSTPARAAAQADDQVPTFDELPADVRRQLPALAINGSKYSDTPERRILIVNGQVFREGDHPVPELTIEQIRLKAVVLRFRGYRYLMSF